MPGTVQVSILELVGLPSPPQSSSMGVKVSMGKQAHEMQDKEETSFALASLRDNLNVLIHDSEGNEIARTDVETRSIVEKGTWDDLFPLKNGGHIRMRLHFILTENELNRIRSMRESAARIKQEDLLKRSQSSSHLAGASGGSLASSQDSLKSRDQTQKRSVDPSNGQANKTSSDPNVKFLNKAQPGQKKQVFSSSKSTGALDKLPAYQELKERIQGQNVEQQNHLDITPSNVRKRMLAFESSPVKEESPAINKTWATTQLSSSTTGDISSTGPSFKKVVAVNTKPVLSKLETAPASTSEKIGFERGKQLPATNNTKEISQSRGNITADSPYNKPKTVALNTKPAISKLKTALTSSTSEEIGEENGKLLPGNNKTKETAQLSINNRVDTFYNVPILKKTVTENSETVWCNQETALARTSEKNGKGRGEDGDYKYSYQEVPVKDNISKTQPTKEENKEEPKTLDKFNTSSLSKRSKFSLKTILAALPRRKQFRTDLFDEKYGCISNGPLITAKKWRSKQWKSSQCRAKSKVFDRNNYSIDSFHGWIFMDEMICSCVLSDDRPVVDLLQSCRSNCSQDIDQEKPTDTDYIQRISEDCTGSKNFEANRRPNNNLSSTGPAGQVMKIAIMAGFGLLVFLTRQRK